MSSLKTQLKWAGWITAVFLLAFFVPWADPRVNQALVEAFLLLQDYAQHHVLLCLVPAFFIAGAISVFINKASILRYFGPGANKLLSYGVASVSGSVLAVCSCTVLPLFAGIYTTGAGVGPGTAFLYSGPAVNVLAIILTAKVLGWEMGLARGAAAVGFSIVVGLLMQVFFAKSEKQRLATSVDTFSEELDRPLWKNALLLAGMVGFLVFANLSIMGLVWRFAVAGGFLVLTALLSFAWMDKHQAGAWFGETWFYAKLILPLLLAGVLISGFLLGRPGHAGLVPGSWIAGLVGGNGLWANLVASVAGAFMYFATLTEVPIIQGLTGAGMGKGPALAMLLSGPAVSLPSVLVILKVMGWKKTGVFVGLIVVLSTAAGWFYGNIVP